MVSHIVYIREGRNDASRSRVEKKSRCIKKLNYCPDWCGSVDWMSFHEAKGHWFNSQSGYMPELQVHSPVRVYMREAKD